MDKKNYTLELNEVISYVNDVLVNEFPKNQITSEYLIMSILDHKNCHANMILDNCMTSNNLEELKKVYTDVLEKHIEPQMFVKERTFDESWNRLISLAEDESSRMLSEETGTEHVLLAVLNEANNFREKEIFERFGLEYSFIFGKCNIKDEKQDRISPRIRPMPTNNNLMLKSQVNAKAFGFDDSNNNSISKYTINLNEMVRNGSVNNIIGRDSEVMQVIKVLARRNKNNAILVGEGGCGKTSIAFAIAKLIEEGLAPSIISGKEVVMLDIFALISGTSLRGQFEERIKRLFDELKGSGRYILLLDDIHNALKNGSRDKDTDISGMLGDVLADGKVRVIATTTFKDYRNAIEANASIARKFQKITVEPATVKTTIDIINANKHLYEEFHNVEYPCDLVEKCVTIADRYITDRRLPDSALDIIDLCGAKASVESKDSDKLNTLKKRLKDIQKEKSTHLNNGEFELIDSLNVEEDAVMCDIAEEKRMLNNSSKRKVITESDMLETVSEMTGVPVSKLNTDEKKRLAGINQKLRESVVGQDEAIDSICNVIKRNRVGLGDKSKALGVFLLVGKTGVGKSLIAKKLAEEIFGDEKALVRIDMSEYSEKSSVSKLLGASPGYVGYENGGQLTEAVKRKQYCVLLLDEIEKADQEVHNVFLQLFDDGRLTDASGQIVNFKNVIVLMTSNVGARKASELGGGVGFNKNESENSKVIIDKEIRRKFTPEFINRIDKIVHFNDLTEDNLKDIVRLELNKLTTRLNNIKYNINFYDNVVDLIYEEAIKNKEYGARPILRLVQDLIEDKLTELMLNNEYPPEYTFSVWREGDGINAA